MIMSVASHVRRADQRRACPGRLVAILPVLLIYLNSSISAQERAPAAKPTLHPFYPRIDLATGYDVVPSWPARPAELTWGAMAGIAIGPSDEVWTFNRGAVPVQVYTTAGAIVRSWGKGAFREPHQVRIDHEGNVWVVDSGLDVVRKYTPDGSLLMTVGTPGSSGDDTSHFNRPTDVAVAPAGDLFVTDGYGNDRVVHFDPAGRFVRSWGTLGSAPGQFSLPHSIALDSRGRLLVADRNNARVQVFDQTGRFLDEWRDLLVPWHIVVTAGDEIYVCGSAPMRWPRLRIPGLLVGIPPKDQLIMVFNPDGRVIRLCTFPKGQGPGELDWLHGMAVDRAGNLYLGDIQGRRAQKFLRLAPSGPTPEIAKKSLPKADPEVKRTGKP
jgi:DNA-binding beta-propeller fold protein YncE